jgi:hypothetical protein
MWVRVERLGSGLDAAFYPRELVIRYKSWDFDRFSYVSFDIFLHLVSAVEYT